MATFQYARKDGSLGSVEAPDATSALRILPADADPHSGVMGGLSGTGTSAPSATSSLPDSPENAGNLTTFADSLDQVVKLMQRRRNKRVLDYMAPYRGSAAASDFNGILDYMNDANDPTVSSLVKRAETEIKGPDTSNIIKATNDQGVITALDPTDGHVLWQSAPGVGNVQSGEGGTAGERALHSLAEYSASFAPNNYLEDGITPTIDSDGFITPEAWRAAIDEAPSRGITREQFILQFGAKIINQGGGISDKYGLTPVEKKMLLGSGDSGGSPW